MNAFWSASAVLALSMGMTVAVAEDYDGSKPFICKAEKGHDCLPTAKSCKPLKPEPGEENPEFGIDVGNKAVHSPYRTATLPIQQVSNNKESLVLQGADLQFAWSMVVHRTTGVMTMTVADRKGAYVVFGQCRLSDAAAAPSN